MPEITLTDLIAWDGRLRSAAATEALGERWGDRELTWAVSARATPPMLPSVRGGEVVLLPARILNDAGVSTPVILRELANHGIAAVVLDLEPSAPAPVPVLIAEPLSLELEQELNRMLTERRSALYQAGTDLSRRLNQVTAAGADLPFVLGAAAAYLNVPAAVVDERGRVLASTADGAAPAQMQALAPANGFSRGWRAEHYLTRLSTGDTLWLGPVPQQQRALARLAAERIAVAAEAALQRADEARPRGPARAAALQALLLGPAPDAARAGALLGLPAGGAFRLALVGPNADPGAAQRSLATMGTVHEAGEIDGAAALLLELRPEALIESRRSQTLRRGPLLDRRDGSANGWIAVSGPATGLGGLPEAARQARYVAALHACGLLGRSVARFDGLADIGIYQVLYRIWGSPELAAFASDALGDLLVRDRRGTLRKTLLAYFAAGGSHVEAAARLGIHRNTLAYRLKQIAALTGREPADPSTQLVLHLALLASMLPAPPEAAR